MPTATVTLASSSSSAINHGAASPSVGDGSTPPVSGLAEGSGELVGLGDGDGLGDGGGLGDGDGLGDGVALATLTGTPLQVAPQPVAAADRVTKVRPLMPEMYPNTSTPSVGTFPVKMAEVRSSLS